MLPAGERRALKAVCDTLAPSLRPGPGDEPQLFATDALSVGVPQAIEEALDTIDAVRAPSFVCSSEPSNNRQQ